MARSVEDPSGDSVVAEPGVHQRPETASSTRDEPGESPHEPERPATDQVEPMLEHEKLLAKVRRLELELERYRAHAQRTSTLFLSVTNYVEWVRENARRDAELALRKARARVEKLDKKAIELERTEDELARTQEELVHLQTLTDVTRERLSAFLTAGLQVLDGDLGAAHNDSSTAALDDLQDTLQDRLTSTSAPTPTQPVEVVQEKTP